MNPVNPLVRHQIAPTGLVALSAPPPPKDGSPPAPSRELLGC